MLKAFFDDSGSDGTGPICLIAGYIASVDSWCKFSDEWEVALESAPRIKYLKMAEAEGHRGEFAGWKQSDIDSKLIKLAKIIRRHVIGAVGSMVGCRVYEQVAKGRLPETIDHPYWPCFIGVKLTTLMLYREHCLGGKIDVVFDQQGIGYERRGNLIHEGWKEAIEQDYLDVLGGLEFHDDREVLPLQTADMIAWHLRRHGASVLSGTNEERPAADILGDVPVFMDSWPAEKLASFVDGYNQMHPLSPFNRPDLHRKIRPN